MKARAMARKLVGARGELSTITVLDEHSTALLATFVSLYRDMD